MGRPAHWITSNHRQFYPSRVIWLDTETVPYTQADGSERHALSFGWATYRRKHRAGKWSRAERERYTTPGAFWDWSLSKAHARTSLVMLAHNAGYDFTVLDAWNELPRRGWTLISAVYDSPPFLMTFRKERATLHLWDTLNWWRVSLAQLGERLGYAKLPMPSSWEDREEADRYCLRDVEILERSTLAWWDFLKEHDLGSCAPTLAAQALTAFRHRFLTERILCDSNETSHELARAAYSGGRVECFRLGKLRGEWTLLDVRSMYPYVMRAASFPTILRGVYKRVDVPELLGWMKQGRVIAEVDLETDSPIYPLRADKRLLFPTGSFRATLTTPELRHAIANDHLRKLRRVAVYSKAPIFRGFVEEIFALRMAASARGDSMGAWYLKIMLNSLYGKFGQLMRKDVPLGPAPDLEPRIWVEFDVATGERRKLRSFAGQLHELRVGGESWWSHPAIAAHVTAYARMHLWRLICCAGRANVAYCDTDSLLVNAQGLERLRERWVGDALGRLNVEGTFKRVVLHGPKDYEMDAKRRTKGVRASAVWLDASTVLQEQWSGLAGLVLDGDVTAPKIRKVTKNLRRRYRKGRVLPGGRTRPWRLPDEWGSWLSE